ncbi:hypothetical protein I350_03420 [Cryptococcus amylolentus CBS 6273]|nr:hypothetical protein I350_03420 [Cryptococcus amylolentus CBS 6273]
MPRLSHDYPGYRPPRIQYLKSFLPVVALVFILSFALSFALSSYSLLSHSKSPAAKQHLGWQAWDLVDMAASGSAEEDTDLSLSNDTTFVPSIPLDNWDPLALHTTGLTEIAVKPCYFPPWLFPTYCAPETTPQLDKSKGKWVIVERDLNARTGIWYLNIYYRRTRRLDTKLITDIRIVEHPPSAEDQAILDAEEWMLASGDLHNGVWPSHNEMRIWYKLGDQSWGDWKRHQGRQDDTESEDQQDLVDWSYGDFINEIDIIYGDDDPFFAFKRVTGGPVMRAEQGRWDSVDIALRKGNPVAPRAIVPTFHSDGSLKIMQIADLHYSVGTGECRDTDREGCIGDVDTATWLAEALEAEQPDLVVFSGDQLNGQETSYDSRSVLAKFAKPVIDRKIPWAAVFGNHDSEILGDREAQIKTLQNMPYSLSRPGPKDVDGFGNCESRMHVFTLYFLDSHDYQKRKLPWSKPDYDYIKTSQIDWYRNVSSSIKPIQRPFTPDGTSDLGGIWPRRSQPSRLPRAEHTMAKPNAMMWFHIPLPEAYAPADSTLDSGELDVGSQIDGDGSSPRNSGFFYNAIKASMESEEGEGAWKTKTAEVKVLSHGHCHLTDRCRRVDGIWQALSSAMCFDGGSSFSGYGQADFDRRVRIYEISEYGEKVESYKRESSGAIVDKQTLVGDGAPTGGGQDQEVSLPDYDDAIPHAHQEAYHEMIEASSVVSSSSTGSLSSELEQLIDATIFSALRTDALHITYWSALGLALEGLVLGAVLTVSYRYYEHFGRHDSWLTLSAIALGIASCIGQSALNLWQTYRFIDKAATAFYLVMEKDIYADMVVLLLIGIHNLAGSLFFIRRTIKLVGHPWYIGVPLVAFSVTSFGLCLTSVIHGYLIPWDTTNFTSWLSRINVYVLTWMTMSVISDVSICVAMTWALTRTRRDIEAAASSLWRKLMMLTFETMIPSTTVVFVLLIYGGVENATFGNFTRALAWIVGPLYFLAVAHSLVSRHDVQHLLQDELQKREEPHKLSEDSNGHPFIPSERERGPIIPTHIAHFTTPFGSTPDLLENSGGLLPARHQKMKPRLQNMRPPPSPPRTEAVSAVPVEIDLDEKAKKDLGFADDNEFGISL